MPLNLKSIPDNCFLNGKKEIIEFIPEKKIELIKYKPSLWKKKFPHKHNLKYEDLQLTNIGIYSIATPVISKKLVSFIMEISYIFKTNIRKIKITETNGGVGGFSISLMEAFNNINIVEIDKTHSEIIINNLKVYNNSVGKNIQGLNEDYLNVMELLENDLIISDPPWGGYDYINNSSIRLGMNNINIICIINELYTKNKFAVFILMAPKNYDIQHLMNNILSTDLIIKNMGKHYFIAVINKKYYKS